MNSYDVIIVGSGSAGAILAAPLSEDPARSVLLVGAGPDYPSFDLLPDDLKYGYGTPAGILSTSHDWGYVAEATPQATAMPVPRGKVTGGSSTVNAQVFLRGVPEDFAAWVAAGNDQWSYERGPPFSANWRATATSRMNSMARMGQSSCGAISPTIGSRIRRPFIAPAARPAFPTAPTTTTLIPPALDLIHSITMAVFARVRC